MKHHTILILTIFISFLFTHPKPAPSFANPLSQTRYSAWRPIASGIAYREFYLDTPNRVYVARLQRDQPEVFIESSIGQGRLSGGSETVRQQAELYNEAINFWNRQWGGRNQVIVAINGSFFDPDTGVPWSGQVQSGWYAKRFADRQRSSGFAWTLDRQAFIGACVINQPGKQQVKLLNSGKTVTFDGINMPRPESGLVIFTAHYDATTPARQDNQKLLEVLVELTQPLTILPAPAQVEGVVRLVQDGAGGLPIPFDHIVLSATGKAYSALKGMLQPGDRIGISQELRHLAPGCREPHPASWTNTYASVAGSYIFLRDGAIQPEGDLGAVLQNPRTAVALNDRFVFFIVVDGRQPMSSLGMSMVELGVFARTRLGATDGIALDGGGSSTMVVNGQVMNFPNPEPSEPRAGETLPEPGPGGSPRGITKVERVVANGLMMVAALPRQQSTRFRTGSSVVIQDTIEVNVRLGPGTNYGILTALPPGSHGMVVEHALNGVLAKGYSWWKIDFAGIVGWVNENSLAEP